MIYDICLALGHLDDVIDAHGKLTVVPVDASRDVLWQLAALSLSLQRLQLPARACMQQIGMTRSLKHRQRCSIHELDDIPSRLRLMAALKHRQRSIHELKDIPSRRLRLTARLKHRHGMALSTSLQAGVP